jgi:CMP-N-acetylneuraminic acid synthetase
MSRVVAVVPLKENSQRFPGKNLAILSNKQLYELILESLNRVHEIDEIYIYSSSLVFKVPFQEKTSKIIFKSRSKELDADDVSINQVLRAFLGDIEADTVILAHATSPFISPETISICVKKVIDGEHDSALAAIRLNKFAVFGGTSLNFDRNQDLPPLQKIEPVVIEQGGLYVFKKSDFLTKNRRVGNYPHFQYVNPMEGIDIDTAEDFELAKALLLTKGINA